MSDDKYGFDQKISINGQGHHGENDQQILY